MTYAYSTPMPPPIVATSCFRQSTAHENIKKRAYQQRIQETKHSSFTPLIFSATGRMAREATVFYKRLASMLATKRDQPYSSTMTWMRCLLLPPPLGHPMHQRSSLYHWTPHQIHVSLLPHQQRGESAPEYLNCQNQITPFISQLCPCVYFFLGGSVLPLYNKY